MSYVKPDAVVEQMVQVGASKSRLGARDLLVRGCLSGAFLGFATTLAFTATIQTKIGLVGALVFPVGFTEDSISPAPALAAEHLTVGDLVRLSSRPTQADS